MSRSAAARPRRGASVSISSRFSDSVRARCTKQFAVVVFASLFACGKGDKDKAGAGGGSAPGGAAASGGGVDCLHGAWQNKFGDKNIYTFNADKSGTRVYMDKDTTRFNWANDGTKITITFPAAESSPEAKFTGKVDCAKTSFYMDGGGEFVKQ